MKGSKSKILEIILPLALVTGLGIVSLLGLLDGVELRVYDSVLRLRPAIQEDPRLTIVAIDDAAIDLGGTFPWSRDITARGLLYMKELGLDYMTFDIEFLNPSPFGVNEVALNEEVPGQIQLQIGEYKAMAENFVQSLASGTLKPEEAFEFLPDFQVFGEDLTTSIIEEVSNLVQDNDQILSQTYKIFGNTYGTLNTKIAGDTESPLYQESLAYVQEFGKLTNIEVKAGARIPQLERLTPPIPIIAKAAKGMGYTNMIPDADGVTRRVVLIGEYEGAYYGTLSLPPLLDMMGNPPLYADGRSLTIRRSALDPKATDIVIPLDDKGQMLINWTHEIYDDSFENVSFGEFIALERLENNANPENPGYTQILKTLHQLELLNYHDNPAIYLQLVELQAMQKEVLANGSSEDYQAWLEAKNDLLIELDRLANGGLKEALLEQIDVLMAGADEASKQQYASTRSTIDTLFTNLQLRLEGYTAKKAELTEKLKGGFGIIGQTGAATTDIGVTPFESVFMNVAVHANVANTILQANFLQDMPPWIGMIISILAMIFIVLVSRTLKPLPAAITSFVALVVLLGGLTVVFVITGLYIGLASPGIGFLASSIALTLLKFRAAEKEKGFIRGAFARYLSDDVIKEIVANPDALSLGGDKKNMTAIFTDVKGFSTISEKLDPTDLVKLLNEYLSAMSDLVLDSGGFIDKYEGDAIIAFWGAPLPHQDHAKRACITAIKMRRIEDDLNKHFMETNMSPTPLLTRIGINTGEMVVGNMGTQRRLNYTIMGNAVNLAARLEGVNKQYGTWILISEYTKKEAGDSILYRALDRVRVVGINTPVRLYEVVDEIDQVSNALKETVAIFERGIAQFENKEFQEAKKSFKAALEITPGDGPSTVFLERCEAYIKTPPKENWDGVFNLTTK